MDFKEPPEHAVEVMLDLETMGTKPWSPVIAIGAVRFIAGDTYPMPPFYQAITLESCLKHGLRIQASTVLWWMKQSAQAKQVFEDPNAVDLPLALDAFTDWYGSRPDRVWGNSAKFDIGLLEDAYTACGKEFPIQYYHEKDYRTLKDLPGMGRFRIERKGTHHNALDDAISQAHHCRNMLMFLDRASRPGAYVVEPDRAAYDAPLETSEREAVPLDSFVRPGVNQNVDNTLLAGAAVPVSSPVDPEAGFVPMSQGDVQQDRGEPEPTAGGW